MIPYFKCASHTSDFDRWGIYFVCLPEKHISKIKLFFLMSKYKKLLSIDIRVEKAPLPPQTVTIVEVYGLQSTGLHVYGSTGP